MKIVSSRLGNLYLVSFLAILCTNSGLISRCLFRNESMLNPNGLRRSDSACSLSNSRYFLQYKLAISLTLIHMVGSRLIWRLISISTLFIISDWSVASPAMRAIMARENAHILYCPGSNSVSPAVNIRSHAPTSIDFSAIAAMQTVTAVPFGSRLGGRGTLHGDRRGFGSTLS